MKTNYFESCQTIDEAKKLYYELAKKFHPDRGGDVAIMQEINNQFEGFKPQSEKFKGEAESFDGKEYANIIAALVNIPEIIIEVCGSWVWVSGNTKEYKEQIKAVNTGESYKRGFSKTKTAWYFSPSGYRKRSKTELTFDQIRGFYGSTTVKKDEKQKLQGAS